MKNQYRVRYSLSKNKWEKKAQIAIHKVEDLEFREM